MDNNKKVIVLGLDGATFTVIQPLVERGELPNFEKIMKEGVYGKLKSTIPPLSSAAWASFMTGMNPSKHGVYDFIIKKPRSYDTYFLSGNIIKAPRFWDVLGKAGKKVIIQNIMGTYPVKPVNGILISGFLTPPGQDYAYPKELEYEIEKKFGGYPRPLGTSVPPGLEEESINNAFNKMDQRVEITRYLMENKDWDLLAVLFDGTDFLQHAFWNYYSNSNPKLKRKKNFETIRDAIPNFYRKFDRFLGELLDKIDENTTLIILSDHGFGRLDKIILMNNLLMDMGLLNLKNKPATHFKKWCLTHHINVENFLKIFEKIGFRVKGAATETGKEQKIANKMFLSKKDIDWKKTKAFSIGVGGHIYINLKGREPKGIVPIDEYLKLRKFIMETIKNIKDPQNGKNIIEKVYSKDEIFTGKFSNYAPDISILPAEGYFPIYKEHFISPSFLMKSSTPGSHTLYGIVMIKGKNIKKGVENNEMTIWDVPAIILKEFNVDNSYMDGETHDVFL